MKMQLLLNYLEVPSQWLTERRMDGRTDQVSDGAAIEPIHLINLVLCPQFVR